MKRFFKLGLLFSIGIFIYLKEPNRQIVIGYDLHSYTTFVVFKRIILDNFSEQNRIKRIEEEKDREYYFEGFDEDFLEILKTEL